MPSVLAAECERQIDLIIALHRRLAGLRDVLSAALTLCHEQRKQLATKDETIARLRDELRQARASDRRAA